LSQYLTGGFFPLALAALFSFSPFLGASAGDCFAFNRSLGRGINLGNALDAPKEGDWGVVLQADYFKLIKEAGFNHIRLPVRWSAHAEAAAPYTIDPAFFDRVDWAIKHARANGLRVVLNMHHYEALEDSPDGESERFVSLWRQIAQHYSGEPEDLAFEIYNEPARKMDADKWNILFARALSVVRSSNPLRLVVVGPVGWNSIDQLQSLSLPRDKNLLVTVHYYQPFHFTHQGASWAGPESQKWLGTLWNGSAKEMESISTEFDKASIWAQVQGRPIYLGEFGAYEKADMHSRAQWTMAVAEQASKRDFSWAYWEFCSGFGAYDPEKKEWSAQILRALQAGGRTD